MSKHMNRTLTAILVSTVFAVFAATPVSAEQGNMEHAIVKLNQAMDSLRAATPNKGGHRERAMDFTQQAIDQVREGIDYANRNR